MTFPGKETIWPCFAFSPCIDVGPFRTRIEEAGAITDSVVIAEICPGTLYQFPMQAVA